MRPRTRERRKRSRNGHGARKHSVRVAAVQIAPDLETSDGTVAKVLAAIAEAAGEGSAARGLPRDLRALVPVLLLRPSAGRSPAPSISASTRMRLWFPDR